MADSRVLAISLVLAAWSGIAPRAGVAGTVQAPVVFQSVSVGSQSAQAIVTLNLSALAAAPSLTSSTAEFSAAIVNCSQLNACEIGIVFGPLKAGLRKAHISVSDASGNLAAVVPVEGTGSAALSLIQPGALSIPIGQGPSYNGPPTPGPGVNTSLETPQAVVIDPSGNVFVADSSANVVIEYQPQSAVVAIIAGTGSYGFSGDGGPASAAQLASPSGLAIDAAGNLYIADSGNNRVRVVSAVDQTITTVAGGGAGQSGTDPLGDGGLAVNAVLNSPSAVVADVAGNLYIADTFDSLVRKVTASTGMIQTVAGCQQGMCLGGSDGVGDGLSATSASLLYPAGIALDQGEANLYIADTYHHMVRMVKISTGVISSVAGMANVSGYAGDGGPAAGATLNAPSAVSVDAAQNLYIADANNFVVRLVLSGNIQTLVGSASGTGFSASGLSSQVSLGLPAGLAIDGDTLWVADAANSVVEQVKFNSAEVLFPTTTTNSVSSPVSFVAANAGNEPLIISSISATSQFSVVPAGTCLTVSSVQPGTVCAFGVVFSPSQVGAQVGQVSVIDNSSNQSTSSIYSASGQSVSAGPAAVLSATTVAFGSQALQVTGSAQAIVLSNSGSASLIITGIALGGANPGDFSMTTTCNGSVAAGAACSVNVTFTPTALGARTATVTISDNAGNIAGSTQLVYLAGNGVPAVPTISLSPTAVAFGSQNVGSSSAAQAVSLSDAGAGAALNISNIAVGGADPGDFQISSSCPASLAPQVNCAISIKFAPTAAGQRSASLTITDNTGGVSGSTQTVSLTGNGVGVAVATITPSAVAFASQTVGTVSAVHALTLSNSGTASLTISSILIGGANPASFQSSNSCGNTVAPGANCTVSVTFAPVGAGSASATLTVTDNVGTQSVSLGGTGIAATPSASLSPAALTFASQAVGTISGAQQITLTNTGNSTLIIAGISIGGTNPSDFSSTNTCSGAVQNGSACTISVAFAPAATGQRAAVLTITDNSGGQTASQVVALNGTAIGIAAAVLSPSTGMLFGNQLVGTTSTPLTATLSNAGTASLSIGSVAVSGAGNSNFASTNSCGNSLAPESSCIISVTFTPRVTGVVSATLVVTDAVGTQTIGLGGTGLIGSPGASLSASAISFGSVASGSTQSLPVSLTNNGSGVLSISTIALSGSSVFSESNTCGASLAIGSTCVITLTFAPTASSSYAATLSLIDSAGTSEQQVAITGSGSGGPVGTLSASSVYFSPVLSGASYPQSVTFSNTGTSSLTLSGISLSGTNSTDFNLTTTCGTTLAVGHSCTLSIVFTPGAAGVRTATLTIADNGAGSPHAVALSGTNAATPLRFVPVTPCRVADTRNATGPFGGPILTGNTVRSFVIPNGACGIPANAAAYLINAAVVPNASLGYLTMWPAGLSQPLVATLTSDGRVKDVAGIVTAGLGGSISVYVTDTTHVILDISGYFVAGNSAALEFYPVTPCRIADTRLAAGALGGPSLIGGATRSFPILSSSCNIPATAQAYSLNFSAVPNGPLGYVTAWPAGQTQPLVSALNAPTGTVTANAGIVQGGTGGAVNVYATNNADLIIDVNGYFAAPGTGGLSLYTLPPCRALDTRLSSGLLTGILNVNVTGSSCSVPSAAQAFVFSVSVVPPGALNYLSLWAAGQTQPLVSTLNAVDGAVTSNMALVPASNGSISAYAPNPTQLILDISSYFAP